VHIRFGPFTLDLDTRQLTQDSREVHLAPKAFDLLAMLALDRPRVVSKQALMEGLWPGTFVAEANVSNLVSEIRDALGDRARTPLFIRTVHGFGYAFCADATTVEVRRGPATERPTCWLESNNRRFPLTTGTHLIGRDADAAVRLEGSTVSRRHAHIVVTRDGTVLEDLGSKNGTFLHGERVTAPVHVTDGDEIHIGSLLVTFRVLALLMSTDTRAWPAR
jgi:DNA-binding winged helix-turn-helix (wHTH) protein